MKQKGDLESSSKYESLPEEWNVFAHRLTRTEFDMLISDWDQILETGYKCTDPHFYGPFKFDHPIQVTRSDEQNRLMDTLVDIKKLGNNVNWNEDEVVFVIASCPAFCIGSIV